MSSSYSNMKTDGSLWLSPRLSTHRHLDLTGGLYPFLCLRRNPLEGFLPLSSI